MLMPLYVVFGAVLLTAVIDLWKFKIHNVVTFPLFLSGLAYHGWLDWQAGQFQSIGDGGVIDSFLGVVFGIASLGVFYCMGGVGAGDVKLLAAIGAWLCLPLTFFVFVASALATGMYALVLIVTCRRFSDTWVNLKIIYYRLTAVARHLGADDHVELAVTKDDRRSRVIPFAAMVALGMLGLMVMAWYLGQP
jgi:prepilin peptidase CpaA